MKTPEEIAADALSVDTETFFGRSITDWIVAAVKADRENIAGYLRAHSFEDQIDAREVMAEMEVHL